MVCIKDGLWLSNSTVAEDFDLLNKFRIERFVVADSSIPCYF
jgi:hypothetical protein